MNQSAGYFLYEPLDQLLTSTGAVIGAAEFHGLLVGALCADAAEDDALALVNRNLDIPEGTPEPVDVAARELLQVTQKQLAARDFQFQLVLPPPEVEMALSVRALGDWVVGFLAALGEIGIPVAEIGADARELLEDMAAIAQISQDEESSDEADLIEVVEYVRVAVFNLYEDILRAKRGPKPPVIH